MLKRSVGLARWISLLVLIAFPGFGIMGITLTNDGLRLASAQSNSKMPEGRDFATLNLRDAWDMSEFSDVSQALNNSDQADYLEGIRVQDGVFSARSTSVMDAQFMALWPGYNTAMLIGKVGHNYPIDRKTFQCLYLAMRVASKPPDNRGADVFQVFWFANELLNGAGGVWGFSKGISLYPEAGWDAPVHTWKLYKVDLANADTYGGGTRWTDRGTWQSLRIDPTNQGNVGFEVDWVRLTDCAAVTHPITWQGGQTVSIYIKPQGTSREILVASDVQSPYSLDVQGLPPGSYSYLVKKVDQVITSGGVEINRTPVGTFVRPSYTSGVDYATQAGNPWDFMDEADVRGIQDMDYQLAGGVLDMRTPSGGDAKIELNSPQIILNPREYRFLSFRMNTEALWQNVPEGMIVRWIWTAPGTNEGSECHLVSQDIPFDVGWQINTIDLSDPFNGFAEEVAGKCDGLPRHWLDASAVVKMRFDPNENILGTTIHQQLDWIRLTKVDQVKRGAIFPVQFALNKSPESLTQITFYFTDDRSDPTQHRAEGFFPQSQLVDADKDEASSPGPGLGSFQSRSLVPIVFNKFVPMEFPPVENAVNFGWDTSAVPGGEYYLCAVVEDLFNEATICSEAPVKVVSP